ncbi:hypothetical protein STSP2_03540 [Anaerohalosphaera lusitana]|uniref:SynChlorMet cassette protein ScmC n=1 Tax=Anaerohalosphaera lusitana TaxID=1936003 RepID=A0A1U9NRJ0_9BACT|nr:hypothetical protein [Anaerohalosphaera lusitana]AQT70334.1 hypothetical protein STSP2_03540 [Anaerohalosphaera lusitana]
MEYKNYVVCKGILGIQTNSDYIGWSFGHPTESSSDEAISDCEIVVRLTISDLKAESNRMSSLQKYHYWRGEVGSDELFYERNFLAGSKLRMHVSGIKSGKPEIKVNKPFIKYIKFRFNNLHSPGYILTDLVSVLLLQKGFCPLHCSGFAINNSSVAVVAPGDTGKTLTTMKAVFDSKADYMAEDLGIVDDQTFYGCPWTSTFRYYDELSMSRLLRFRMKMVKIFPPVELLPVPGDHRNIDHYISTERIRHDNKLTHLALLARRPGGIKVLDNEEAENMLFNLNRYEFCYMKSPMLIAYSYFNDNIDLMECEKKEREVLSKLVENAECLLVQSEDPTKFAELIFDRVAPK